MSIAALVLFIASLVSYRRGADLTGDRLMWIATALVIGAWAAVLRRRGFI